MRALVLMVFAACAAGPRPTPPTPAPAFAQLEASSDLDGVTIGASDASSTVVIVMASWCGACREELARFDHMRAAYPRVRWLAVNYKQHEEYDARGNADTIRALAHDVPWLRIVPAGDELYTAVGRPTKIPTVLVFDRRGALVAHFDRAKRGPPSQDELDALLR